MIQLVKKTEYSILLLVKKEQNTTGQERREYTWSRKERSTGQEGREFACGG